MNRHRWIMVGLSTVLVVLIAAVIAVAIQSNAGRSTDSTHDAAPTTTGPFWTASTLPTALANRPIPQFDLSDARGGRFTGRSLRGQPYAITFLYVHCVDVCPLIGSEIHQALAKLGRAATRMIVVAISVDPRGDTRTAVNRWLEVHREPANFHYLIGSERSLSPIWKAFYVTPQTPGDPHSSHTAIIWLVNRHDRLAALIPAGLPVNTTDLAQDFATLERQ